MFSVRFGNRASKSKELKSKPDGRFNTGTLEAEVLKLELVGEGVVGTTKLSSSFLALLKSGLVVVRISTFSIFSVDSVFYKK